MTFRMQRPDVDASAIAPQLARQMPHKAIASLLNRVGKTYICRPRSVE